VEVLEPAPSSWGGPSEREKPDVEISSTMPDPRAEWADVRVLEAPEREKPERKQPAPQAPKTSDKSLNAGDGIRIYLRGIPDPDVIEDEIDAGGMVTLPHIGRILLVGMTPSQAERVVEKTYVERKIYNRINVTIVAPGFKFYVSGEVNNRGGYPLSSKTTLQQAITTAGGYTEYANRRKVAVHRGTDKTEYNAERIENGEIPDPLIEPGDIIKVERKRW